MLNKKQEKKIRIYEGFVETMTMKLRILESKN